MPEALQFASKIVDDCGDSTLAAFRHRGGYEYAQLSWGGGWILHSSQFVKCNSGPQNSHLVASRFAGHDTVMECKNTQKLADGLISLECREFDRIVSGHEWKLMDSAIGIHNLPSGAAQIS